MAIALVNTSEGQNSGAQTSVATAAAALSAGNLNVIILRLGQIDAEDVTVTDTAGNLYRFVCEQRTGDGATLSVWFALDTTAEANNVVTATFPSSPYNVIVAAQFSGVATQSPLDAYVRAADTGGSVTSPQYTTTVDDEVVIMAAQVSAVGGTWATAAGYTLALTTADGVVTVQYKVIAAVETDDVTADPSSTQANTVIVVTFNEDFGGGGGGGGGSFAFVG